MRTVTIRIDTIRLAVIVLRCLGIRRCRAGSGATKGLAIGTGDRRCGEIIFSRGRNCWRSIDGSDVIRRTVLDMSTTVTDIATTAGTDTTGENTTAGIAGLITTDTIESGVEPQFRIFARKGRGP